ERVIGATRAGLRYARYAPPLAAVLVRTGVFIVCGSAFWALLPVIARRDLGLSALGYGLMLTCFGFGVVVGAALLPRVKRGDRLASDDEDRHTFLDESQDSIISRRCSLPLVPQRFARTRPILAPFGEPFLKPNGNLGARLSPRQSHGLKPLKRAIRVL